MIIRTLRREKLWIYLAFVQRSEQKLYMIFHCVSHITLVFLRTRTSSSTLWTTRLLIMKIWSSRTSPGFLCPVMLTKAFPESQPRKESISTRWSKTPKRECLIWFWPRKSPVLPVIRWTLCNTQESCLGGVWVCFPERQHQHAWRGRRASTHDYVLHRAGRAS